MSNPRDATASIDTPQIANRTDRVLIVDSDHSSHEALSALMEAAGYKVQCAPNGRTALTLALEEPPDVILLDPSLPDLDGFKVCQRLKDGAKTLDVPVIFLSALEDNGAKVKGFSVGAADYVAKPYDAGEVLARVQTHLQLRHLQNDLERRVEEQTTALRVAEKELQNRLNFETLLSNLSAKFVHVPSDQVDREIEDAQRQVCDLLGLDLSALWQWSVETPGSLTLTHVYRPLGGPPPPDPMDAQEHFPWSLQQLLAGKVIALSSIEEAPVEAALDKEVWRHYGIKTNLAFPLSTGGGSVVGVLSFNDMRNERDWPDQLVNRLQLVAQIFANALARKRADEALRESEARLALAAASAGVGLWELDLRTGRLWTTDQARNLFGIPPDRELTLAAFLAFVHPEDRERILQVVEQAKRSAEVVKVDYRNLSPDGRVRWMVSCGRLHPVGSTNAMRLMGVTIDITERKELQDQLQARLQEIERLKQDLEQENVYLREEAKQLFGHDEIIGQSDPMRHVLASVDQVAPTDSTVLIVGETGTGKEVVARAIHSLSKRKDRALVTVNCASLPPSLIEGELFGREKGAYTGAMTMMRGRFEFADGSTLFLDEIGELPLEMQAKLLRVLEEGRFERLGSSKTIRVDVRIIAASNRDLAHDAQAGTFRKDLYYRLSVFPIAIPPLRERPEDIPLLAWAFVRDFEKKMGKRIESIQRRTMEALRRYPWPGNVRELRNVIEHAMIVSRGCTLDVRLPTPAAANAMPSEALADVERAHILHVLERTRWRLTGEGGAADQLGLKRTTLQSRMKKLGITRPTT